MLHKSLPKHGRIYLSSNYFCFHSQPLVGKEEKLILPVSDIIDIQLKKVMMIPSGIEIVLKDGKHYTFFSFFKRKAAFECMKQILQEHGQVRGDIHTYEQTERKTGRRRSCRACLNRTSCFRNANFICM